MRRLSLLVAVLFFLTACSAAQPPEQSAPSSPGSLRPQGTKTGQISSPATQTPPTTTQAPPMTTQAPPMTTQAPPTTTQAPPTTAQTPPKTAQTPTESPCTYPSDQTLAAKGHLLVADGEFTFYRYGWGAGCDFRQPVDAWLVHKGNVSPLLKGKRVDDLKAVTLPGGEHGYLIDGEVVTPAASAYYLGVVRYGELRLFRIVDAHGSSDEWVLSTDDPRLEGDQLHTAQRMGGGSSMVYVLRSYRIDPQSLTATKISEKESRPDKAP
jgi:hypothetical protein